MSEQSNNSLNLPLKPFDDLQAIENLPIARFDWDGRLLQATKPFLNHLRGAPGDESLSSHLHSALLDQLQAQLSDSPEVWATLAWPGLEDLTLHARLQEQQPRTLLAILLPSQTMSQRTAVKALNNLPVGLVIFDSDEQLVALNSYLADILSLDRSKLVDQEAAVFWDAVATASTAPEITSTSLRQARSTNEEKPQVELELAQNPPKYLQVYFFGLPGAGSGAVFVDNSQARDQVSWKLDLLSMLAHDLRTPLATLKGHATALTTNYSQWSQAMVLEFLQAMDQGVDDLVRRVDRSLALTRLESGRLGLQLESVSTQDLIQGSLERAASALGESRIQTQIPDGLPEIRVDPARIEEVLVSLLENAARFSSSPQQITLSVSHSELTITFSVVDSGPGVPAERRQKIFEKNSQVGGQPEKKGLGLFISRKIVEAHGGRIWVESPPTGAAKGSAFRFTIPVIPAKPESSASLRSAALHPMADQEILIVEEDIDLQSLFKAILEPAGYQLRVVSGGPGALDFLAHHSPAAVILDLNLSRMDGHSVCRSIRRRSPVPILVLTPQSGSADLLAAIDAGADDYLAKPFQSADLLARIMALQRRANRWRQQSHKKTTSFGELEIDQINRQAIIAGDPVHLTPTEFDLLSYLAHHQGQVLTHNQLIDALWPLGKGNRHSLFVHINRLRAKIEPEPEEPTYLVTRWGVGYSFLPKRRLS